VNEDIEVYTLWASVTEAESTALCNYVYGLDKESKAKKSFQLSKDNGIYAVKMVVDQEKNKIDSTLDDSFKALRMLIEMEVFKGAPTKLVLASETFEPFKTYEPESAAIPVNTTDSTTVTTDTVPVK